MPTYEVRTVEWLRWPDWWPMRSHLPRALTSAAVSTHATYADAVAARDGLNEASWADREFNPFLYGGESLFFQSTLPPGPFRDYLQDRGFDVPQSPSEVTNARWVRWYKSHGAGFTDGQCAAIREAMNLVRVAEVTELPDGAAKVYVVQELNWHCGEGESSLLAGGEGGKLVAAYCDRALALGRCRALNAARRWLPKYLDETQFLIPFDRDGDGPTLYSVQNATFYDVVEIDWVAPESSVGSRIPVTHRQALYGSTVLAAPIKGGDCATLVPLRAFANQAAAAAHAAELTRTTRRVVNPMVVYRPPAVAVVRALGVKFRVKPLQKWGVLDWQRWYEAEAPHLTDDERAKVWALFDARPLYGVTDVPWGD